MSSTSDTDNPSEAEVAGYAQVDKPHIAAVVERRRQNNAEADPELEFERERDLRQQFRRLIDPGIVRPNSKETFMSSLNILLTIAQNLLADPDNPKYQRFKPTNTLIKKHLVEVPGALEYAIAMGFRAEVENFQPYYNHSKRYMKELRVGASIITETLERENIKTQREERNRAHEKEVSKGVTDKVKMNYLDDRKQKKLRDEMERQRRQALAQSTEQTGGNSTTDDHPGGPQDDQLLHDTMPGSDQPDKQSNSYEGDEP